MTRVGRKEIDQAVARIRKMGRTDIMVDHSNGGWRAETLNGSRTISPRLPARELLNWLDGYYEGMLSTPVLVRD